MRLSELLKDIYPVAAHVDCPIKGLSQDSRQLQAGDLFFAYPGHQTDGRKFISEAIARGAAAVLLESDLGLCETNAFRDNACLDIHGQHIPGCVTNLQQQRTFNENLSNRAMQNPIPLLVIPRLTEQIGLIAARFYQHPSQQLKLIAITGTSGKTSCSHFIAACLQAYKRPCGVIGSLGNGRYGQLQPSHLTTPDMLELQGLLAQFQSQGLEYASMEVSSHRLAQRCFQHLPFTVALFTNLSHDHLDYHGNMDRYAQAKRSLFDSSSIQAAVLNADDPYGAAWLPELAGRFPVYGYSLKKPKPHLSHIPHSYAQQIDLTQGLRAYVHTPWGEGWLYNPRLMGIFNLSNLLAVLTTLGLLGLSWSQAILAVANLQGINGRMECFGGGQQPLVVVDYAYKPAALQQVLQALRPHCVAKLWCVFGCGGNRDRSKRALMGQIAEAEADACVITHDNPRREDPEQILADILEGFTYPDRIVVEPDRRQAIAYAITRASAGDIVLIAGKGHECYQLIADEQRAFSDSTEVKRCLVASHKTLDP